MEEKIYNNGLIIITYNERFEERIYKIIDITVKTTNKNSFTMKLQFEYGKNSSDIDIEYYFNSVRVSEDIQISKFSWDFYINSLASDGLLDKNKDLEPNFKSIYNEIILNLYDYAIPHNAKSKEETEEIKKLLENAMNIIKERLKTFINDFINYDFTEEKQNNIARTLKPKK